MSDYTDFYVQFFTKLHQTTKQEEAMSYQYGDKVVFTDEFNKEQIGTVTSTNAYDMQGMLAIDSGSIGTYIRESEEVRLAQDYEVHQAEINRE